MSTAQSRSSAIPIGRIVDLRALGEIPAYITLDLNVRYAIGLACSARCAT